MRLKESADAPETGAKIRSLLVPVEYTRLDDMVDVMFTTATDIEGGLVEDQAEDLRSVEPDHEVDGTSSGWQFTDSTLIQAKRESLVAALSSRTGRSFVRRTRALYWDASHAARVACTVSKKYETRPTTPYWYAYHPRWDDFLGDGDEGFFVLGCMDLPFGFAIPWATIHSVLPMLNTTTMERGMYWHIHITMVDGQYGLLLPKGSEPLPLDGFRLPSA